MTRRTILRFARPTTLQAILDSLVSRTNTKQGPDRPQVTTLRPVVAEETDMPVFAEAPPDGKIGFVYCAGQCSYVPPGEPPVVVSFRPLPGCGCEQDGVFSGAIVVYAWQHPEYPMSPKEVEWSIAHDCGCEDHAWSDLSLCWQKVNAIAHDDLQDLAAQYTAGADAASSAPVDKPPVTPSPDKTKKKRKTAASHRGTRQPRKISSRFLMTNIWDLDDVYNFEHLFNGYCHIYEDSEGHLPSNPRASFLEAAYSCAERIIRQRGQN